MRYKIIINVPNEDQLTEILITKEELDRLVPIINTKKIVEVGGTYFNTTYIAKIIPDTEAIAIEKADLPQIERYSEGTQKEQRSEGMGRLKDILKNKKIISEREELEPKQVMTSQEEIDGNPLYYSKKGEKHYH